MTLLQAIQKSIETGLPFRPSGEEGVEFYIAPCGRENHQAIASRTLVRRRGQSDWAPNGWGIPCKVSELTGEWEMVGTVTGPTLKTLLA